MTAVPGDCRRPHARRPRAAFTLIELLVVIAIIGILIAAIGVGGARLIAGQKARYSESILRTVQTAVDQFATEDPLRTIYNRPGRATFGPYPPYMIAGEHGDVYPPVSVRGLFVEPDDSFPASPSGRYTLASRLARDMSGRQVTGGLTQWVSDTLANVPANDRLNDNRALYTYMAIYSPGVLAQIPQDRVKPVNADERVFPGGLGGQSGKPTVNVLTIRDAWDVPIDYFLATKVEVRPDPNDASQPAWQIADRKPVFVSRGVPREAFDSTAASDLDADTNEWIVVGELPSPAALGSANLNEYNQLRTNGLLPTLPDARALNGWVRARALGDAYDYVPPR